MNEKCLVCKQVKHNVKSRGQDHYRSCLHCWRIHAKIHVVTRGMQKCPECRQNKGTVMIRGQDRYRSCLKCWRAHIKQPRQAKTKHDQDHFKVYKVGKQYYRHDRHLDGKMRYVGPCDKNGKLRDKQDSMPPTAAKPPAAPAVPAPAPTPGSSPYRPMSVRPPQDPALEDLARRVATLEQQLGALKARHVSLLQRVEALETVPVKPEPEALDRYIPTRQDYRPPRQIPPAAPPARPPLPQKRELPAMPVLDKIPDDITGVAGDGDDAGNQFQDILGKWKKNLVRPRLKILVAHDFEFDVSRSAHIYLREQKIKGRDDVKIFVFDWLEG